jgi:hypothetical protein
MAVAPEVVREPEAATPLVNTVVGGGVTVFFTVTVIVLE